MHKNKVASRRYRLLLAAGVLSVVLVGGCERTTTTSPSRVQATEKNHALSVAPAPAKPAEQAVAPAKPVAPAKVAKAQKPAESAPLLLEEEPTGAASNGSGADNSRCFVCHVNYMTEEIAVRHAKMNIGCATCHGASDAHIADESWASGGNGTAPDRIYTRDQINGACMHCHPKDKIDAPQHQAVFVENAQKVCTDCHGKHRLPQRRCKWK